MSVKSQTQSDRKKTTMNIPELDAAITAEQRRYKSALESIAVYVTNELRYMETRNESFEPSRGLLSAYSAAADAGSRLSSLLQVADKIG